MLLTGHTYVTPTVPYCASALKVTFKTSPVALEVTFHYKDSKNVRQYEAYVDMCHKCSRPGSATLHRCLIKGLDEAKEYVIHARVCLSGKPNCELEMKENTRTELRGEFLYFYLVHYKHAVCGIL